jgi:hypothetical protein
LPSAGRSAPGGRWAHALDRRQAGLVSENVEMIIPQTDTPGARAAGVPEFIDRILADWHPPKERRQFLAGLDAIDSRTGAQGPGAAGPLIRHLGGRHA